MASSKKEVLAIFKEVLIATFFLGGLGTVVLQSFVAAAALEGLIAADFIGLIVVAAELEGLDAVVLATIIELLLLLLAAIAMWEGGCGGCRTPHYNYILRMPHLLQTMPGGCHPVPFTLPSSISVERCWCISPYSIS